MDVMSKFDSEDDLKHLKLNDVLITDCVLGQGSFGTVYKAKHHGTSCAVKKLDLKPHGRVESTLVERRKQNFLLECLQHSKLYHPNIVKMLGVFYPKDHTILSVLVMELMEYNLTQLLERSRISMYLKLSILQDVSRGLCYLHAQNPPIVHQALYSDNILFTKGLTAKIGDFKTGANTVSDQALLSERQQYNNCRDFLPLPKKIQGVLKYELPLNVFSFGCMVCHVITGSWPNVVDPFEFFSKSDEIGARKYFDHLQIVDDWYYTIHQTHVKTADYTYLLKCLAQACLQHDPNDRPYMSQVYERITSIMTGEPEFIMYKMCIES